MLGKGTAIEKHHFSEGDLYSNEMANTLKKHSTYFSRRNQRVLIC